MVRACIPCMGNLAPMNGRKRRQAWNVPGHGHALNFSTYRRQPWLTRPGVAETFLECLDEARRKLDFQVWAYCVMPDHAHVALFPNQEAYAMADVLRAIKLPATKAIFDLRPELREACRTPQGEYRFWQVGGVYDRNLFTARAAWAAIRYGHNNPVEAGLCETYLDWPWSSAGAYLDEPRPTPIPVDLCRAGID